MSDGERFEVAESFLFVGRTFEEYGRMFGLAPDDLRGRSVLDCPGGPSSFTAVAAQVADRAAAVDPRYGPPPGRLASACTDAVDRNVEQLREKRDLFVWDHYGDPETRGRYLRAAYERFLADYARHPGRYVEAGLPELPFETDAFDLVLSANLLFLYDDRLDAEFHAAAARELARVAREEARVFPLASLDRRRSSFVDRTVDRLRADGCEAELRAVPYEFQPGATETLVISEGR